MTFGDLPVRFMAEQHGKIFIRVPHQVPGLVCESCGHAWKKPANVIAGDSIDGTAASPRSRCTFDMTMPSRLRADFNGLFGDILCLSHADTCPDQYGVPVALQAGMLVTAYDEDSDEHGKRDDLVATGTIEPAPDWLTCRGSKWVLRIDDNGVRHESDLEK